MPNGSEINGIVPAKLVDCPFRKNLACLEVMLAAKVVVGRLVTESLLLGHGGQNFESFGGDFRSGAIASDDSYLHFLIGPR